MKRGRRQRRRGFKLGGAPEMNHEDIERVSREQLGVSPAALGLTMKRGGHVHGRKRRPHAGKRRR